MTDTGRSEIDRLKTEKKRFMWGAAGSAMIEFARLYNIVVLSQLPLPPFPWYYYLFSVGAVICGGVVACALRSPNEWSAFYSGGAWLYILSTLTAKSPEIPAIVVG